MIAGPQPGGGQESAQAIGRLVELSGREYMVRGRGYVKSVHDIEDIVLRAEGGTPVLVRDVAKVALGHWSSSASAWCGRTF